MSPVGQQDPDVEALVAALREEAAQRRERAGPATVLSVAEPPVLSSGPSDAARLLLSGLPSRLQRLRDLADPRPQALPSHRALLAPIARSIKSALIRLLTPIWDQQTTFARDLVETVAEIVAAIGSDAQQTERRLRETESRLAAVEAALARQREQGRVDWNESGFDYERFEDRFRGPPEQVARSLQQYLTLFPDADSGPVLDLGCGNGILLKALRGQGVGARGVDQSGGAVERCRAEGLDVTQGDLLAALEHCDDDSLGGVTAIQVLEHLSLPVILQFFRLARQKLRPGGLLIAETVNLASLIVFARAWTIDPTHRQALHPLTLQFLAEEAGFSEVQLSYSGEVELETRMEIPASGGVEARNAAILNQTVFGPQDYAVIARA